VTLQRFAEFVWDRLNTARLLDAGAVESGRPHYPLIMLLPAAWLAGLWILSQLRALISIKNHAAECYVGDGCHVHWRASGSIDLSQRLAGTLAHQLRQSRLDHEDDPVVEELMSLVSSLSEGAEFCCPISGARVRVAT